MNTIVKFFCFALIVTFSVLANLDLSLAQEEADPIKVATFEHDLENLPPDLKPVAVYIQKAKDAYFATFSDADSPATRDAGFAVFYAFYMKVLEKLNEDTAFFEPLTASMENLAQGEKVAAEYGFKLTALGEGTYGATDDTAFLLKTFGNSISPAWKSYFIFTKKTDGMAGDGGLYISYDELRQNIVLGDAIIQKNPHSVVADLVRKTTNWMSWVYLLGLDNTPIYDLQSKKILPEVKKSYEKFLNGNKTSALYPIVQLAYNQLKKDAFKVKDGYFVPIVKELRKAKIME